MNDAPIPDDEPQNWRELTAGIVRRFEVAASVGGQAIWNAQGSAACATIIKKMAAIIDDEIDSRRASIRKGSS